MRSEFHQHFEAGASVRGIYQQVRGEKVKAGKVVCSCRYLERRIFGTSQGKGIKATQTELICSIIARGEFQGSQGRLQERLLARGECFRQSGKPWLAKRHLKLLQRGVRQSKRPSQVQGPPVQRVKACKQILEHLGGKYRKLNETTLEHLREDKMVALPDWLRRWWTF